jgi:large subunit ribosomal protein L24
MAQNKLNIKKDDRVLVIAGRDRGKVGKVLRVIPDKHRALVEKVNMIKRHSRGGGQGGAGGIIEKEAPVELSDLMVICNKCTEPTRVGRRNLEDGGRVRYCKKCGELLES